MASEVASQQGIGHRAPNRYPRCDDRPARFRWEQLLWLPGLLYFVLLLVPQGAFLELSLHADTGVGQVAAARSLSNYIGILSDPFFLKSIWLTFYLSLIATAISIAIAVPAAYALARIGGKIATVCLSLVLTTSLITVVIKLMGLSIFLSPAGLLNQMLRGIGLIDQPLILINNQTGVLIGLVQYTLPILVLLLFGVVQTIPVYLEEAAEIHGATRARIFFSVIVPSMKMSIVGGGLIAFNMSMGAFTSAVLLGGGRVLIMPVLVQQYIIQRAEYGYGAALAALLLLFVFTANVAVGLWFARMRRSRTANA